MGMKDKNTMFIEEWADYKVCGICGRDNAWDDYDWPDDDICPSCKAQEDWEAAERVAVERRRESIR